jgi:hypothetical protein
MPCDRSERLRVSTRRVAEPRRLPTRQDYGFHYPDTFVSGSAVSGSDSNGELGRPMPS